MNVNEFLNSRAQVIIERLQPNSIFSTRHFIWELMSTHEIAYIELLSSQEGEHPIRCVHQQIGKYLDKNAENLGIAKENDKESSVSPFGHASSTQLWRKL